MHAAIYARVSTERQERQQTIDSQLTALRAWAEAGGHDLNNRHVFRDEGYSGARLDRPGLDALRDAVRDGEVEIVAVLAPDRLARRYAYQVLLLEEFRRVGCTVAFLNHTISDDPGDQLLLQIQGAVAEYERALLSERFRRGKLQKARAGQFIGVHAPYGFRYLPRHEGAPGRLLIDDTEAETVRLLYTWLTQERMTLRQILKRLNFGPWFPRCGRRPWSPSTVHHILSDPVYTGTAYSNRYEYVPAQKPRSRKPDYPGAGCRRLRPKEQWIPIAVAIAPVQALGGAFVPAGADQALDIRLHQNLEHRFRHRSQEIALTALPQQVGQGHCLFGHRVLSGFGVKPCNSTLAARSDDHLAPRRAPGGMDSGRPPGAHRPPNFHHDRGRYLTLSLLPSESAAARLANDPF